MHQPSSDRAQGIKSGPAKARIIVHVDMDEFFVQVERHRKPDLLGVEKIAIQQHGDIICVSHAARRAGVTKHVNPAELRREHPDVRIVHVHQIREKVSYEPYRAASHRIFAAIAAFLEGIDESCFQIEEASIDELFFDATEFVSRKVNTSGHGGRADATDHSPIHEEEESPSRGMRASPPAASPTTSTARPDVVAVETLCVALQDFLKRSVGYHCTLGVGKNRLLAKWAAGLAKPRRIAIALTDLEERGVLCATPVRRLPRWSEAKKKYLVGQLALSNVISVQAVPLETLQEHLGKAQGTAVYWHCRGTDHGRPDQLRTKSPPKSVGAYMSLALDPDRCIPVADDGGVGCGRAQKVLQTMAIDLCHKVVVDSRRYHGRRPHRLSLKYSIYDVAVGRQPRLYGPAIQTAPTHRKFPSVPNEGEQSTLAAQNKVAELAWSIVGDVRRHIEMQQRRDQSARSSTERMSQLCFRKFVLEASHFPSQAPPGQQAIAGMLGRRRPLQRSETPPASTKQRAVEVLDLVTPSPPAARESRIRKVRSSPEVIVVEQTPPSHKSASPGFASSSLLSDMTPEDIFNDERMAGPEFIRKFIRG